MDEKKFKRVRKYGVLLESRIMFDKSNKIYLKINYC